MGLGSRKPKPEGKSRLFTEKEQLRQAQLEITRKRAELEKKLQQLPDQVEQVRQREKELQRINVTTHARGEINGRLREFRNTGGEPKGRPRRLRGVRRAERVKFWVLCLILLSILVLVWRTMPA